jgi:hypothetical protein
MFKTNKYTTIYFNIIQRARTRIINDYTERHHIIPKCMGGSDEEDNIVKLTAREHFICHLLLIRMTPPEYRAKLVYAAWQLSRPSKNKTVKVTNRIYALLKEQMSASYTGRKRKPFSDEWKANMRLGAVDRKRAPMTEHRLHIIRESVSKRKKLFGEDNPFYGKTHSADTIEKIIEVNKRETTCPYCNKTGSSNVMKRWHFDNCRLNSK